jgi:hypothetical protein
MIGLGGGLFVAGAIIATVGLASVFVPTDLGFLGIDSGALESANPQLLPFIAHDRAGFGGALMGAGLAVLLISLWGWRRGERWVWWSLVIGCAAGTTSPLVVHLAIGYTTFEHLLPLYVLVIVAAVALTMSHPYLTARSRSRSPTSDLRSARSHESVVVGSQKFVAKSHIKWRMVANRHKDETRRLNRAAAAQNTHFAGLRAVPPTEPSAQVATRRPSNGLWARRTS